MARPSKLTDKQWDSIGKRLLEGESARALAKEFGVSEGAIRKRKGTQIKQIKTVANQMVAAEMAFRDLPIGTQISTQRYASKLMSISDDLLDGSAHAASTFRKLSAIASTEMQKVDTVDPMESAGRLKVISIITGMANESAKTPINLIAANKDAMNSMNKPEAGPSGLAHFYGDSD